jgi:hypothetical protein
MDNMANFDDIISCLEVLGPFVTIAGLLFVYGPPTTRLRNEDLKTIQWVQCFCGPEFFRNVTIVTSQWDTWSKVAFNQAWVRLADLLNHEEVAQILDPLARYHGGSVYHHGFPGGEGSIDAFPLVLSYEEKELQRGDELRNLIRRRYADSKPAKLQVAREVESGIPILETEAAKVLKADMVRTKIRIHDGRAVVSVKPDAPPTPSSAGQGSPTPPTEQPKAQPQQPPKPAPSISGSTATPPPKAKRTQNARSWSQKLWDWFEICKQAAVYFEQAGNMKHESRNDKTKTGPVWSIWGSFRDWWWGSPKSS